MSETPRDSAPTPPVKPRTTLRRLCRRAASTLVITYLAVCAFMYGCQNRLIYFPTREMHGDPSDYGMKYTDVSLETDDRLRLFAWYAEPRDPRAALILCHGNAGNISHRLPIARAFYNAGLAVLMFDYRGYGRSKGSPDEPGTYLDAEAAWCWLTKTKRWPPEKIIVYGESIGAAVAIELSLRHPPAALIAESGFTAIYDVARRFYPFLPVRLLCRSRYESIRKIPQITCPKLFIHSPDDELVPFDHGKALFEAAPAPRQLLKTRGGHNDGGFLLATDYVEAVHRFIDRVLTGQAQLPDHPDTDL